MAYVTKSDKQEHKLVEEAASPEKQAPEPEPESDRAPPPPPAAREAASSGGFFHIYKKGQGYWTRMGTVIGIALVGVFTAYNFYLYVPTFLPAPTPPATMPQDEQAVFYHNVEAFHDRVAMGVSVAFLVAFCLLGFWITNKPTNVDFLIATDSEMKKVNWTSRRELIGSTRIVIIFMFTVAIFLFVVDILFGYLFYVMHVLKNGPFGA
jgi:preprotein translocase SecE subunit